MSNSKICGLLVSTRTFDEHVDDVVQSAFKGSGKVVITLNLEMVARSYKDRSYRELLDKSELIVADGMPIVWASHLYKAGMPIAERTNGTNLVMKILKANPLPKVGVIGGINPKLALEKMGCLDNAYVFDGKVELTPRFINSLLAELMAEKVQLLFIALGVPRQDLLASEMRKRAPHMVIVNVGGAFDLLAGLKPRAPVWVQNIGGEWLVRLLTEPKRLWRRYLLLYPYGVWNMMSDILKCNRA